MEDQRGGTNLAKKILVIPAPESWGPTWSPSSSSPGGKTSNSLQFG